MTSTVSRSPACRVSGGIASPASGGRLGTVTRNDCDADSPPGSVAVTSTLAAPRDSAASVTSLPDARADTTPGADDTAS